MWSILGSKEGEVGVGLKLLPREPLVEFLCMTPHFGENDYITGGVQLV